MKSIKIFYSDHGSPAEISEGLSVPMDVNFKTLEKFYSSMGEKHKKNFDKLMEYWRNEGFEKLFNPQARVVAMPFSTATDNFGSDLPRTNESVDDICMAVWTIGPELEKTVSSMMADKGELMLAFLLDVAGSIALYNMHSVLLDWLKGQTALCKEKYINGEYYPGMGSMRQDLMERVVLLGETERIIGVGASGNSLLRPRKSQCSFIALGSAEHEVVIESVPCKPCLGNKCLYHQLGGCHMQEKPEDKVVTALC